MSGLTHTLLIRSSPHIHSGASVDRIMRHVVFALLPACGFAVWNFGWSALATLLTACLACGLTERWLVRSKGKSRRTGVAVLGSGDSLVDRHGSLVQRGQTSRSPGDGRWGDGSVWVTGLLYGMTLPPALPLWMVVIGGVVAVLVGKWLFGGLGSNPFNPALVGRAFLQAAFPAAMTTWSTPRQGRLEGLHATTLTWPFGTPPAMSTADGITSATPLARYQFEALSTGTWDLYFGMTGGSTGETSAVLLLLGGVYLAIRRMLDWRIPVAILGAVAVLSGGLHTIDPELCPDPIFMLGAGGLMLGALFMATDMVTSPITHSGRVIFGILIGSLVFVIRVWGGMPEGVMYAILLGNATVPLIDRAIQPAVYGTREPSRSISGFHRRLRDRMTIGSRQGTVGAVGAVSPQAADSRPAPRDAGKVPETAVGDPTRGNVAARNRVEPGSRGSAEPKAVGSGIGRMYAVVLGIGMICSVAIVAADYLTAPIIARQRAAYRQRAVLEVLPGAVRAIPFVETAGGKFESVEGVEVASQVVFAGYDERGDLVGLALEAEGQGYQDRIRLMFGYAPDRAVILAMKVLASRETPGLGDRIESDPGFLANFGDLDVRLDASGVNVANPIEWVAAGQRVNRWELDGITGATVTCLAVAEMLRDATSVWVPKLAARRQDFERTGGISGRE